ncbi:MAG: hypothetical protein JSV56_02545 [Methanomassiliicoccales archaeon]|nr:MAG: hypothetical protein JSV56_02545 [Methanomassiliicoccales archaeon]
MATRGNIHKSKSSDKYHWILYHLEAIEYGQKKIDTRMAKLPSSIKLQDADPEKLKKVISELKEIISWYKKFVEYHQQKALSHIPETEKKSGLNNKEMLRTNR